MKSRSLRQYVAGIALFTVGVLMACCAGGPTIVAEDETSKQITGHVKKTMAAERQEATGLGISATEKAQASDNIFEVVEAGDLGRARQLIKANPMIVNERDRFGNTPLQLAVWRKRDRNMTELLLDRQAEINARCSGRGATALHWAAEGYDREVVELLFARGADVHAKDKDGRSVLLWAVTYLRKDLVELLLAKGADVNAADQVGWTPLHWIPLTARERLHYSPTDEDYANRKAIAQLLLDNGAEVNARSAIGATPLHIAARELQTDVVELYLGRGTAVNATDESGLSAPDYVQQRSESLLKATSNEDARAKWKQRRDEVTALLKRYAAGGE